VYTGYFPQPFKVFELNPDGTHKRQIDFVFMELQGSSTQDHIWAPGPGGLGNREYCVFVAEDYSPAAKSKYVTSSTTNLSATLGKDDVVWNAWLTINDESISKAYKQGTTWTLKATKIITSNDKWSFSMKPLVATLGDRNLAKTEVGKINVFPNPYFAFNTQETNKYNHFVTFNHLPTKATIRIFNVAGVLVRTLVKNDASSTLVQWDLNNQSSLPVAAGMYIAYIDLPDVGTTRTLKFAIIPGAQYLDRY
jgi:hypothetical protein